MFVDASVLSAMLLDEDDARLFGARLQGTNKRLTSPLAVLEAVQAVSRALALSAEASEAAVRRFLELMAIQVISLPVQLVPAAAAALGRFGAGHPAGLDISAALAYAAARYYRLPLLYKNPAFALTDIEAA